MSDDTDVRLKLLETTVDQVKGDVVDMKSEMRSNHTEILKAITAVKDANSSSISEMQKANAAEIAALKEANSLGARIKSAAGYVSALLILGGFVGALIAFSPVVSKMEERLREIDAPKHGRLDRLDESAKRLEKLTERLGELVTAQAHKIATLEHEQRRISDALNWRPTIARAKEP